MKLTFATVDVMKSILPEELQNEVPSGFNTAGHVGMWLIPFEVLNLLKTSVSAFESA